MHNLRDNGSADSVLRHSGPSTPAARSSRAPGGGSFVQGAAQMSPCGVYRYYLMRNWDICKPTLCWIMLNPSTANDTANDATIRVCMGRARKLNYGNIVVVNLFALRSTNPRILYRNDTPISSASDPSRNAEMILYAAGIAQKVICAWGKHGAYMDRARLTLSALKAIGVQPYALRINKDGSPAHPLRIPYDEPLKVYG